MTISQAVGEHRLERSSRVRAGWRLVFTREFAELWVGGKALNLLILFSALLGITAFLIANNTDLQLIPVNEVAYLVLTPSISFGLFIGLIIGADSISGERERGTLEALLLTPASRRQIVLGKFLAALTPWPAALAISFAFMGVLSDWNDTSRAVLWGGLLGSVQAVAFTGLGMLISIWSRSNRTSMFVAMVTYFIFLLPTQFIGQAQKGAVGVLIKRVDPMEATNQFLEKVLVNNRTPDEMAMWLLSPALFVVGVLTLLFWYASPGIHFDGGRPRPRWLKFGRAAQRSAIATALFVLGAAVALERQTAAAEASEPPLRLTVDVDHRELKAGDSLTFDTLVTHDGGDDSFPLVVSMNIINLGEGDPVDPEDWSPQRTQAIELLSAGQSVRQNWQVDAIIDGDYMVYMVAVPEPADPEQTSQPVASSGIHLTVTPHTTLNPGGVLPLSIGIPVGLTLVAALLRRHRRRAIGAVET